MYRNSGTYTFTDDYVVVTAENASSAGYPTYNGSGTVKNVSNSYIYLSIITNVKSGDTIKVGNLGVICGGQ